jgi:hypothetical protein
MTDMFDLFTPQRRTRRSPFDRVGVMALIWAGVFVAAAAGLTLVAR